MNGFVDGLEDAQSGFVRLGARDYDPAAGRSLTPDPLLDPGEPQQWTPYGYGNRNPIMHPDPTGLIPEGQDPHTHLCWLLKVQKTQEEARRSTKKKQSKPVYNPGAPRYNSSRSGGGGGSGNRRGTKKTVWRSLAEVLSGYSYLTCDPAITSVKVGSVNVSSMDRFDTMSRLPDYVTEAATDEGIAEHFDDWVGQKKKPHCSPRHWNGARSPPRWFCWQGQLSPEMVKVHHAPLPRSLGCQSRRGGGSCGRKIYSANVLRRMAENPGRWTTSRRRSI